MSLIHKGQKIASNAVTGDTTPIGAIIEWGSDTIPDNYLLANGQAVSRTTYSELFALWGTTFGAGDGSTTFNVLNKKGRVGVGKDTTQTEFDTIGETGGAKTHTLTTDEIPSHKHGSIATENSAGWGNNFPASANAVGNIIASQNIITNTGGGQAHNNLQPYLTVNYIIKAKQSSGIVAKVIDNLDSDSATDALSAKQGKALNEKLSEVVLYNNATGTTGTVTLSETSANFTYIELYYKDINNNHNSTRVYQPNGKTAIMIAGYADGSIMFVKFNYINISGTSITKGAQVECQVNGSNSVGTSAAAYFTIYRVVGYR